MSADFVQLSGYTPTVSVQKEHAVVQYGTLSIGNDRFEVKFVVRNSGKEQLRLTLAYIKQGSELLWNYRNENFSGTVHLISVDGVPTICYVGKSNHDFVVEKAIPLADIIAVQEKERGGVAVLYQRKIRENLLLRRRVATLLGIRYMLSDDESKHYMQAVIAEQSAKLHPKKVPNKSKETNPLEKRKHIICFSMTNTPLIGVPVVGNEWHSLPHKTPVILVESYDETSGNFKNPIEAFRVNKTPGGKIGRTSPQHVQTRKANMDLLDSATENAGCIRPEPTSRLFIYQDEGKVRKRFEVLVFQGIADIRTTRKFGYYVDEALMTALDQKDKHGRYTVFKDRGMTTVGLFKLEK